MSFRHPQRPIPPVVPLRRQGLLGVDERIYQLRAQIPACGSALRVAVAWTREHVMLRFEGREVARVKTLERPQP